MSETRTIDTRGLSCPQPVLAVRDVLRTQSGTLEVLVDTGTSHDNVVRTAKREGWQVSEKERLEDAVRLVLTKNA